MTVALVQASINGGAYSSGFLSAAFSQTVALRIANSGGVTSYTWEIYDYPPGFSLPAGWSNISGVYTSNSSVPPVITLPASGVNNWGPFAIRLRVNGNPLQFQPNGAVNPAWTPAFTDEGTIVDIASPGAGMVGMSFNMGAQYDTLRSWVGAVMQSLRSVDGLVGAGAFSPGNDLLGNGTSSATHQYVSSLSFSSAAAGGDIAINGTSTRLVWAQNAAPSYTQAQQANASNPNSMHCSPQAPGAAATNATTGTPGGWILDLAAPVNGGAHAPLQITDAGLLIFQIQQKIAGFPALWLGNNITPSNTNFFILSDGTNAYFNAASGGFINFRIANAAAGGQITAAGFQLFSETPSFGGGVKVLGLTNATTAPTSNPSGGCVQYATAGANTNRGSGGTVTTMGPA